MSLMLDSSRTRSSRVVIRARLSRVTLSKVAPTSLIQEGVSERVSKMAPA